MCATLIILTQIFFIASQISWDKLALILVHHRVYPASSDQIIAKYGHGFSIENSINYHYIPYTHPLYTHTAPPTEACQTFFSNIQTRVFNRIISWMFRSHTSYCNQLWFTPFIRAYLLLCVGSQWSIIQEVMLLSFDISKLCPTTHILGPFRLRIWYYLDNYTIAIVPICNSE